MTKKRKRRAKKTGLRGFAALILAGLVWLGIRSGLIPLPEPKTPAENTPTEALQLHFIDVGQGDAILLQCNGEAALIDGGGVSAGPTVAAYLKEHRITTLRYLFATHPHEDHVGGLTAVMDAVAVQEAYCSTTDYGSVCFSRFLADAERCGISVQVPRAGDSFMLGGCRLTVLAPLYDDKKNVNNLSLVLRGDYEAASFLLAGDMERDMEQALMDSGCDLKADLLKVGHHGSNSSTGYQFLWNVMPQVAVISVGEGNDYQHPTEAVLSRLRDAGAAIYRTDRHGSVVAVSDGGEFIIRTEKNST